MKSHSERPERLIDAPCDLCKAKPGKPCLSVGGKVQARPHMKRIDAFWGGQPHSDTYELPITDYLDDVLGMYVPAKDITEELRAKARKLGHGDVVKLGIYKKPQQFTSADVRALDLFHDAVNEP